MCDFCGHDIGIKVMMEGMQALPKEKAISHDAVEISERRHLFSRPKVTSDEISGSNTEASVT